MPAKDVDGSFVAMQDAFRQAKSLLLSRAGQVSHVNKHDGSPVTDTDIEVEQLVRAALGERFPDLPVYGEEGGYEDSLTGTFWLVDPIDGTKSFIENVPTFTIMAALIKDGETVASIIYNPSTDEMYSAQKGKGAFKNGVRLDLGKVSLPPTAICKELFFEKLNNILSSVGVACAKAPSGGGFGFTLVADGTVAARFNLHSGGYTHDYAPGALLISEAGGIILPVLDDMYTYKTRSFVACHPGLEAVLRPHVAELRQLEAMEKR